MRIDPTALTAIHDSRPRTVAPGARAADDQASVVSLGAAARATGINPTVTGRIERIRELLASGDYQVDLDKLAERILDDDVARTGLER